MVRTNYSILCYIVNEKDTRNLFIPLEDLIFKDPKMGIQEFLISLYMLKFMKSQLQR